MRFGWYIVIGILLSSCKSGQETVFRNPLDIALGDSYVFLLASDGHYYMYGTGGWFCLLFFGPITGTGQLCETFAQLPRPRDR